MRIEQMRIQCGLKPTPVWKGLYYTVPAKSAIARSTRRKETSKDLSFGLSDSGEASPVKKLSSQVSLCVHEGLMYSAYQEF